MDARRLQFIIFSFLIIIAFFISGCGDDDLNQPLSEGYFIDAPVSDIRYATETQSGRLDTEGLFFFKDGEFISFYIDEILLGQTKAKTEISMADLEIGPEVDIDGDGFFFYLDCDDNNSLINPGAEDICGDAVDQDCSGADAECENPLPDPDTVDDDGDGFTESQGDCDDNDPTIHPGAIEMLGDAIDQDCNGTDQPIPQGGESRLRISVKTQEAGEGTPEGIGLDISEIWVCGTEGCQIIAEDLRFDLLNQEAAGRVLADVNLSERRITSIRMLMGDDGAVSEGGTWHPLHIGSGKAVDFTLSEGKLLSEGLLTEILLDFNPIKNIFYDETSSYYLLTPELELLCDIEAPISATTTVIDPGKGGD